MIIAGPGERAVGCPGQHGRTHRPARPAPLNFRSSPRVASHPLLTTGPYHRRLLSAGGRPIAEYIPSPFQWVREQVELYERTNGAEGHTLRETGMPVIIVTNAGNKSGAVRKTPLMRVKDGNDYVLVGSMGGAPKNPVWVYNLRANPEVEIRDRAEVQRMRVREVDDDAERARLWTLSVAAFPPYEEYQQRTARTIPLFVAEPA